MSDKKVDFGMVGLGVMGKNLLLNIAEKGFSGIGLDKDAEKVALFAKETGPVNLQATASATEFVDSLKSPKKIMMLEIMKCLLMILQIIMNLFLR